MSESKLGKLGDMRIVSNGEALRAPNGAGRGCLDGEKANSKRKKLSEIGNTYRIRGCEFDAGWEFDAPCFIYDPFFADDYNGLPRLIEDRLIDLMIRPGEELNLLAQWKESATDWCEFQGFSMRNLKNRKQAWHYECVVKIIQDPDEDEGVPTFELVSERECFGPFEAVGAKPKTVQRI